MYQWRATAQGDLAHAQDDVNPHILHMVEGTFLLDVACKAFSSLVSLVIKFSQWTIHV